MNINIITGWSDNKKTEKKNWVLTYTTSNFMENDFFGFTNNNHCH